MPRAPEPVLTGSSPFQQHQPASASTPPPTPAAPATSVPNTYASAARTSSCSSPSAADRTPITSEGGPHASRSTAQPNSPPQHHPSARALTPTKQLGQQPCSQHHPLPPDSSSLEPPDNFRPTPQADGHQTEQQQQQRVKVPPSTLLQAIAKEVSRKLFLATLVDTKEDHDVIIQEVFVDLTRVLDKNRGRTRGLRTVGTSMEQPRHARILQPGDSDIARAEHITPPASVCPVSAPRPALLLLRGLGQHYADPGSAASALDLLRLFQGLWNHCWIAPVYALLLHRWLLQHPDAGGPAFRVKHFNVFVHGIHQLFLNDAHAGVRSCTPLWYFLAHEAVMPGCCGSDPRARPTTGVFLYGATPVVSGMTTEAATVVALPERTRCWLLSATAAFLPYYSQPGQLQRHLARFPRPDRVRLQSATRLVSVSRT
ncbi:MAG: hypothetical protein WDW38_000118 [Sanguina aurantia]